MEINRGIKPPIVPTKPQQRPRYIPIDLFSPKPIETKPTIKKNEEQIKVEADKEIIKFRSGEQISPIKFEEHYFEEIDKTEKIPIYCRRGTIIKDGFVLCVRVNNEKGEQKTRIDKRKKEGFYRSLTPIVLNVKSTEGYEKTAEKVVHPIGREFYARIIKSAPKKTK